MAIYPCGDETGVYYLIVSGLPWSATWQKLKDFVRYPETGGIINVEVVFIYPSSTDGWVKVRGKEDFRRAYEYLNGRVFQGKAIAADDRNGYTIVNLRDMAPILTVSQRERGTKSSPETYYVQHAEHATHALSSPPYAHQNHADSYAMCRSSTQTSQQDLGNHSQLTPYSPASAYSHPATQSGYSANYESSCTSYDPSQYNYAPPQTQSLYLTSAPEPSGPVYAQQMQIGYGPCLIPVGPVSQLIRTPPPPPPAIEYHQPTVEANRQITQSEPRKIIICQLPPSITENELRTLLERATKKCKSRSTNQLDEYPIEHFQILRYSDGQPKGHAFATFYSPSIAKRVVDVLDGRKYQRHELKVRLTKEGVDTTRQVSPPNPEYEMYTVPPDASSELVAQMGCMSMSARKSSAHSSSDTKRERRDKGKSKMPERGCDVDNERERRSTKSRLSHHHSSRALTIVDIERDRKSGVKSSQSVRGPLVVDGSGKRRHR